MKIVFLDIDGVVATSNSLYEELSRYFGVPVAELHKGTPDDWCTKTELSYPNVSMYQSPLSRKAIENIYQLQLATKCHFVLSSSWRHIGTINECTEILSTAGLRINFIGKTGNGKTRGEEITHWIENVFPNEFPDKTIESYIIIDDDIDYDIIQTHDRSVCVKTNFRTGFTKSHLKESVAKLLKFEIIK